MRRRQRPRRGRGRPRRTLSLLSASFRAPPGMIEETHTQESRSMMNEPDPSPTRVDGHQDGGGGRARRRRRRAFLTIVAAVALAVAAVAALAAIQSVRHGGVLMSASHPGAGSGRSFAVTQA